MTNWVAVHRKVITAAVGVAITAATAYWGNTSQWVQLAILVATTLGVYGIPNAQVMKK